LRFDLNASIDDLLAVFAVESDLASLRLSGLLIEALTLGIGWDVNVERDSHFSVRCVLNSVQSDDIYGYIKSGEIRDRLEKIDSKFKIVPLM
jgi:hypothetical protein